MHSTSDTVGAVRGFARRRGRPSFARFAYASEAVPKTQHAVRRGERFLVREQISGAAG